MDARKGKSSDFRLSQALAYPVVKKGTRLYINFAWLDHTEEEKKFRERFADELKTIPVFAAAIKQTDGYPVFTIDEWRGEVDKFMAVIDKLVASK
jgi:hypothetical protein